MNRLLQARTFAITHQIHFFSYPNKYNMLQSIIAFSIRQKLIIGLLVLALIITGVYQTTKLPIDAVPDITNNQVLVITQAPSFGASDIERLVTYPLEQVNSNIAGIKEIRSFSRFGLSLVTIVFNDDIDVYWARQQVAERLLQVQNQIPKSIGVPELGPISTGLGEIFQYVLRPKKGFEKKYNTVELRTIQDWIVRRQLMGIKGVAEVSSFGGKLKQYEVAVNTQKLNAYGITISDVFNALEQNNQNTGGAYIEKGPTVLYIRTEGLVNTIDDIGNIAIPTAKASVPLFVKDVAQVNLGFATRYGAICYNDQGEVAGGIVMMLKGANSSEVIKAVKQKVETIKASLPEGIEMEAFLDRTKMVNNAISTVEKNLIEGALIVVFVLVLFLGNIRAGLLVASVIPLAMLFAICLMNLFGVSGNLMSLGALDFGLIVDGAVIIVEAVMHQLHQNKNQQKAKVFSQSQMNEIVGSSASKLMNSAVFGQLIILIVYLPIFALQGIEGKMFKPMAQTVAFALLGAFVLSVTYIPMMASIVISKRQSNKQNWSDRLIIRLQNSYKKILVTALHHPKKIIAFVLVLFISAIVVLTQLGGEFIPELEEGDFAVETRILVGSNLSTTIQFTQKAAHILKTKFPEVEKVVTKIGSGEVPTDPMPMEASDLMIILKEREEWTSAKTFKDLAEKMSKALQDVPGVTFGFQYPVQMRFNELMTGARQDVVCKLFGENLDSLAHYAAEIGKIASSTKGAADIYVEPINGLPQVVIEYNRQMLAQYKLTIDEVNKLVNTALAGQSAGLVFEQERRFDLVVRLEGESKKNVEDIKALLINTPIGIQVPLQQIAMVSLKNSPNQIQREDAKRRITVGFNIGSGDVQTIVKELQAKIAKKIKLPSGYFITYGGSFENLEHAKQRLQIAVPIALLLIFILLFMAFNSIKQSLLIYSAIPLSAIGGIFSLALRGMPFSISAGIGFIALFGVSVLNGIVLITAFNKLKESNANLMQSIIEGSITRLRPILITALVASLGFMPMALSYSAGSEVQRPLATVVIGGLLVATLLTLFVLPILYLLFESKHATKNFSIKAVSVFLVCCFFGLNNAKAQTTISLDEAINLGLQNNLSIKNKKLKANYAKALISTSKEIPKTAFGIEAGQINSALFDSRLTVSQSFELPKYYNSIRQLYAKQFEASLQQVEIQEYDFKKQVTELFYLYGYLISKEKILQKADSLYTNFYNKANLRLQKGESNVLEKTTAHNLKANINLQLQQLQQDKAWCLSQFNGLLNSTEQLAPLATINNVALLAIDSSSIATNPILKLLQQQQQIDMASTEVEKSKLLPSVMVGYNNNSFRGVGADEKLYSGSRRFHSVHVGVGIPIFTKAQKNKIEASKMAANITQAEVEKQKQLLTNQYKYLVTSYKNYKGQLNYYSNEILQNAQLILQTANTQFIGGEINYLDFVQLVTQALSIESNYAETIKNLNQTIIQINYLSLGNN